MRRISVMMLVMAIAVCGPALATVIHVPGDYAAIQAGINASVNGDTVLVSPGTYSTNISFMGKNIVLKSQNGPEVTTLQGGSNIPIVQFSNGERSTATLEGFTIRGVSGNSSAVIIAGASATIKGNIFTENYTIHTGAAIIVYSGDTLYVLNNIFRSNSCGIDGGAIMAYGIKLVCRGNEFYNNMAHHDAGAIQVWSSNNSVIDHNLFVGNNCLWRGAAVSFLECTGGQFYNNTMVSNSDSGFNQAAALTLESSSNINIYNNIVANNYGHGIWSYPANNCFATYNDVWGNIPDYLDIIPGAGSISADPLFVGGDPYSFDLSGSPCIDAGNPASPHDPDGTIADMGAFYVPFNGEVGYIAGIVSDNYLNPLEGTIVVTSIGIYHDTSDAMGHFILTNMRCDRTYDISLRHPGYIDRMIPGVSISPNDTTHLDDVQLIGIELGSIAGMVVDSLMNPLELVHVEALNSPIRGTTDLSGHFTLTGIPSGQSYDVQFSLFGYADTILTGIFINQNDTTFLDTLKLIAVYDPLSYILGDINGDGDATPLADVIYGQNTLIGGPWPPISTLCVDQYRFASADVNNSCNFDGIDIVYCTNYWRGMSPDIMWCQSCPAPRPDPSSTPWGPDPGNPDTIIIGNLDRTPVPASIGETVSIPVWIKNDETVPALNIPLAADTAHVVQWLDGIIMPPLSVWGASQFTPSWPGRPSSGYATKTLICWRIVPSDTSSLINTNGEYLQIATFRALLSANPNFIGDVVQIIPGNQFRAGGAALCDSAGLTEWAPVVIGGEIVLSAPVGGCDYVTGDVAGNHVFNGLDVTYSVGYFKGGPPPSYQCDCPPHGAWYVAGDVNASCSFNGLDVTYMVAYFKGGPPPHPCPDCPPRGL